MLNDLNIPPKIKSTLHYDAATGGLCLLFLGSLLSGASEYSYVIYYAIFTAFFYALFSKVIKPQIFTKSLEFKLPYAPNLGSKVISRLSSKYATQVIDNVFWKTLLIHRDTASRGQSRRNAIIYHEYGHIYYNDSKVFQFITVFFISGLLICIAGICVFWFFGGIYLSTYLPHYSHPDNIEVRGILLKDGNVFSTLPVFFGNLFLFCCLIPTYIKCVHSREFNADNFSQNMQPDGIQRYLSSLSQRQNIKRIKPKAIDILLNIILIWQLITHANVWARITHPSPTRRLAELQQNKEVFNPISNGFYAGLVLCIASFLSAIILSNGYTVDFSRIWGSSQIVTIFGVSSVFISILFAYPLHSYHCACILHEAKSIRSYAIYIITFSLIFGLFNYTIISIFSGEIIYLDWSFLTFIEALKKPILTGLCLLPIIFLHWTISKFNWPKIKHPILHSLIGFSTVILSIYLYEIL